MSIPFYGYCAACKLPLEGENLLLDGLEPICKNCWLSDGSSGVDHHRRAPKKVIHEQLEEAFHSMDRELDEYVHMPFPAVDRLVGAIPPGDVGFVVAFSGGGKTTFVTSAIDRWLEMGKVVYVLPLESRPKVFRTHLACKRLRLHSGMVLTGEYKRSQPHLWPSLRSSLRDEMMKQEQGDMAEQLYVSPTRRMDVGALETAAKHARDLGAQIFVIDHIDHIAGGDGRNPFGEGAKVVDRLLDLTLEYEFVSVATSQMNNEALKGSDKLARYQIPQPHHVYMGGKKRQVQAWGIGLGRPLKFDGLTKEDLAAARNGTTEAWRVLEPNCMSVGLMKSRHFGERDGHVTYLSVTDGVVGDMDPAALALKEHGIRTSRTL